MQPVDCDDVDFVARLIANSREGGLATHFARMSGYPYASSTAIAADALHRPWMLLSRLSEHRANLEHDPRASMHLVEPSAASALSAARVTLVGNVAWVREVDRETLDALLAKQPDWAQLRALGDFDFFVLEWTRCRAIRGFGRMGWVEREHLALTTPNER